MHANPHVETPGHPRRPSLRQRRLGTRLWRTLRGPLRIGLMAYVGLMVYLTACQRHMIYYPARADESELLTMADQRGLEPWRNDEGEIIGWRPAGTAEQADHTDCLLLFHGNAGYALDRTYFVRGFGKPSGAPAFIVHLFEYPGYGARPGRPSETRFLEAAEQALRQLQLPHADRRLFLAGESIGSGVAALLAARHPDKVDGVCMITPFTRLADVAAYHYPFLPVRWLLRDRYPAVDALRAYDGPLAVLLAENDTVIPARFGRALYEAYQGPKKQWVQAGSGHNTLDYHPESAWWAEVIDFLKTPASR